MVLIGVHPRLDRELGDFDHGGKFYAVVTGKQGGCIDRLEIGLFLCSGRFCAEEDIPRLVDIGRTWWIAAYLALGTRV